jgi:hypothetical protein
VSFALPKPDLRRIFGQMIPELRSTSPTTRTISANYKPLRREDEIGIILGDGDQAKGIGTGSVMLGKLELQKVIYAPDMEVSVISTIALTRRGFTFVHQSDEGRIIDKNQEVLLKTAVIPSAPIFLARGGSFGRI